MASDNSFYIGIPAFGAQAPINYNSSCPQYIQITGISQSVENVGTYYNYTMQLVDPSSLTPNTYIIHYCNASSEEYNGSWMNYSRDIFAHNGSNQYYNSIDSLPVGTKYWTARTDVSFGNCNNSWPNFGHPGDWGQDNVQVYLFNEASTVPPKTTITLNKAGGSGGTDTVYGTYDHILPHISIPTRNGFEFSGYSNERSGSEPGELYYNSDGDSTQKWTQIGGTATLYAKWTNTITFNPHDGECWAVDADTPGIATTGPRTINISSPAGCPGGRPTFTTNISGWTVSSTGQALTIPSGTSVGTRIVTITAESPSSSSDDGYIGETITRTISITIKSPNVTTYSGIYITDRKCDLTLSSTGAYDDSPEANGYGEYYYDTASGKIIRPATGYVKSPWFDSRYVIPASQITIDSSNRIYYVVEKIYAYQKIINPDFTEDWVEIPLTWGGSHTFASLGTTETERKITQFNRDITFTFSGQGGSRNVLTFNLDDYISSPDKPDGTEEQQTKPIYREANTHSDSWSKPVVTSVTYSYPDISACGGISTPSVGGTITQNGERRWTSGIVQYLSNSGLSNFTKSYYMTTGSGFSIDTSTGVITQANSRGKSELAITSNIATLTLSANGESDEVTATCTQSGNTYEDSWPDISMTCSYPDIDACGGTSTPIVNATQGKCKRIWGCNAGEETLDSAPTLSYEYYLTIPNGFTMDSDTGVVTAPGKQGRTTDSRSCTVCVYVTGGGGVTAQDTVTCTQSGNTYTYSWTDLSVNISYPDIGACGGTSTPTVSVTYSECKRIWGCDAGEEPWDSEPRLNYRYFLDTPNGFTVNKHTGVVKAPGKQGQTTHPRSCTVWVVVSGDMYTTKTVTCTQSGNTYIDSWDNPSISAYSYPNNIAASGGTSTPTVTATQSGTRTWDCDAGTEPLSNDSFTYSYSMTTGNGFSINTSTGKIMAENRGTTPGVARTATAKVTVTGSDYRTAEKTAACTQDANELEGITFTVGSKTIPYQGTTKGTVTARYTSGSTKDVENDANTSYTANPNIVTFNKTS